jgi:hypothetical protein
MGSLLSGVFLTGFALALGASELQIGILAALPAASSVAQLAGAYWLERINHTKTLCVCVLLASRLLWLPMIAAPWLFGGGTDVVPRIIVFVAAGAFLSSMGGIAWLMWIRALIPESRRVEFLGRRNQINTVLALAFSIMGGLFIDWWHRYSLDPIGGFVIVFGVAVICGLVGLFMLAAIPNVEPTKSPGYGWARMFGSPWRDRNFRRLIQYYAFWNLAVQLAAPFFAVVMLQRMGLPFWYVTLVNVLASLAGILANGFWVRLIQHFGIKPIVSIATLADAFFPLSWVLLGQSSAWLLLPLHLMGVFTVPLALGPHTFVLKLAPYLNGAAFMSLFAAVVGPVSGMAAIFGGSLIETLAFANLTVGPLAVDGVKFVFLLSFVGRLSSLYLLASIAEPNARSISRVFQVEWRLLRRKLRGILPTPRTRRKLGAPETARVSANSMQPPLPPVDDNGDRW